MFGAISLAVLLPLMGALFGAIIGSFLATLVVRWPAGQSVMAGRSRCDHCATELGSADLFPIMSYFWQLGRCRYCGEKIAALHVAIEISCALIGLLALWVSPDIAGLSGAVLGWILIALIALDVEHHWLPDRLVILLAVTGLLAAFVDPNPAIMDRVIGGASGFLALWIVRTGYRMLRGREGMGAGDPKLFGAIGCWLGWELLPLVLLLAALLGLANVLMIMTGRGQVQSDAALPLGAYLGVAAFPVWIVVHGFSAHVPLPA